MYRDNTLPIGDIIDGVALAHLIKAKPSTVRTWASRQANGESCPEWLPAPVGVLNGGVVWSIDSFKHTFYDISRSLSHKPGRRPMTKKRGR